MVAIVTLKAGPECVPGGGSDSPFLQALDMGVLREGEEKAWIIQGAIDGSSPTLIEPS